LPSSDKTNDEYQIAKIIHDSFGWALTKDRALFESIFAKDDDFFTYYPDSKSTVVGWKKFEKFLEGWMDPGVLEKRCGSWKICQQHMSEANDKISK